LEEALNSLPHREITTVMGDFNAKIGDTSNDEHLRGHVGRFATGVRNESGEKLIQFALDHQLAVVNTMFQQHIRRLVTWVSPGDRHRNQIDYILVSKRWKSSCRNAKTLPGAECGTDHRLLMMEFRLKLRAETKLVAVQRREVTKVSAFKKALREHMSGKQQQAGSASPNELWTDFKQQIVEAYTATQPKKKPAR
jgi:hypothetical protein